MTQISLKGKGNKKAIQQVTRTLLEITAGTPAEMLALGDHFVDTMKDVLNQPGSGRTYPSKTGAGLHQASAPGEPPAPDTGNLRDKVGAEITKSDAKVVTVGIGIEAGAEYWEDLEFGTDDIDPRPFVRRAYNEGQATWKAKIQARVKRRGQKTVKRNRTR